MYTVGVRRSGLFYLILSYESVRVTYKIRSVISYFGTDFDC